jgi:opacity protein-like surface antigen
MKKVILLSAALVMIALAAATNANAQGFRKGDWFLSGQVSNLNMSYAVRSIDSLSSVQLNVAAHGGYFVSDKLAVDATLGVEYSKLERNRASSSFTFGAGVRYYPVGNLFAGIGYAGVKRNYSNHLDSYLMATVGYDLFLSEKVFFEPAVIYSNNLTKNPIHAFGLSLGVGVKF